MMVWQRGPAPQQHQDHQEGNRILRDRAIKPDALQEFQRLDHAVLPAGQRSSPSFSGDTAIDVEWFINKDIEQQKARTIDLTWVISLIYDDEEDWSVPKWGAFNEAISVVNPPVTTAGMLPILQAPADDNDTVTTVINRFIDISNNMGQKHTIVTCDQPLYSRGKELVWANPKFENVIFLMGGLHVCFNFLKAIGQHMESAGLDDVWTEAGKKKPIRKLVNGPHVPLPQVWSQFVALDENKADIANFLSAVIIEKGKHLPQRYELVTGGGFLDATCAKSTRRDAIQLRGNHEEADTRLILHSFEAVNEGYERVLVICRDTDVMLLLIHFITTKPVEVWMISGTAKKRKCYPLHIVASKLSQPVRDNLLSFHALTGCDTTSAFSGHGKKLCWKTFIKQPLLVSGIGRDGDVADIEQFVCHMYGTPELTNVDHARLQLFSKAKTGRELLPATSDALELHTTRANYQAKIWLQADQEQIHVPPPIDTLAWKKEPGCLKPVWTRLPPIPEACLELVTCSCKSKCRTARCSCLKKNIKCTYACACDMSECCNPAGQ